MSELVVVTMAIAALVYVMAPIAQRKGVAETEPTTGPFEAEERKARALRAILDLEADLESGKLGEDDFEMLRAEQEGEVLDALRELDILEASTADDLEARIAAKRALLTCPKCGATRPEEGRCPSCGA